MAFHVPELYRIRRGRLESTSEAGNNGAFTFKFSIRDKMNFLAIASDGLGWEHVSVSLPHRCPTWDEMCQVKAMFWDEEDVVIQYHAAKKDYINCHPYCLHLWRPIGVEVIVPPSFLVGF